MFVLTMTVISRECVVSCFCGFHRAGIINACMHVQKIVYQDREWCPKTESVVGHEASGRWCRKTWYIKSPVFA